VLDLVSPELAREYRTKLDELAGRRPRLAAWIPAAVDPAPEAHAQLTETLVGYLAVAGYDAMLTAAGFGDAVELARAGADRERLVRALPAEAATTIGLVGDIATVAARMESYAAALDQLVLVPATAGDPAGERTLTALAALA
jgi:alkanesulfonate monooxygenase SsuD/methylene tetrahydromethanopterin reductase-like flavin-dependent oxidoreductase (luciferase family)